ncbi:lysin B [Gordonia phage ChisanaKitsune]|uniref:Lysin B n=1 Tax=Gordonia phage ChisanaKitsune TaxID=2871538 RepID=A0AAE8BY46_9CAUD|nr:endolysin [Gordonia phage ChisanaKitsune]QZE10885.1 lysin B [Gordonia phage ChisanaKitsune]
MAAIDFYWARGTGERFGDTSTMYANVARLLDKSVFDIREVPCIAEIRPIGARTLNESVESFILWMEKNKIPNRPWMGGGFSLGALMMGNYVRDLHLSLCKGIGLLADPARHPSQYYGPRKPDGYGIAGPRKIGYQGGYPVWSMTEPGDAISELPGDNGLRNLTPFVGLPKQPRPAREADVLYTMQWFGNYFPGNRHVNYAAENIPGTRETYVRALAREINTEGRRLVKAGLV